MVTDMTLALKQALSTMFARIEAGEDITPQLLHIDTLAQEIAPTAPAMLKHYLERRSYTKALAFLEQEMASTTIDIDNGQ